jgi:Flp pilus assembly secretin CpaC
MRSHLTFAAALAAFLALASSALALPLVVHIDQNARVTLPGTARDVMIGNPSIADVAILDGHNILVLGKSFGTTSLMVTDARGHVILNTQVVVAAQDEGRVSLYRGPSVQTFACAARCEQAGPAGSSGAAASAAPAATPTP